MKPANNPIVRFLSAIYGGLIRLAQVAGALSLISGVTWGVYQYHKNKQEKQLEQTFTLFRQFNNSPYAEYREKIRNALEKNRDKLLSAAVDEEKLEAAVTEIVASEKISNEIYQIMDFYDGLVYCVVSRNCDPKTTYRLFYSRARETYNNFYQYIILERNSSDLKELGTGLETVARINSPEKK